MTPEERTKVLDEILEKEFSGYDFGEYFSAEGEGAKARYVMIDSCSYAWLNWADDVTAFNDAWTDGFEPIAVIDLDTCERWNPRLNWDKEPA